VEAPPPELRELEVQGSYQNMVTALRAIGRECGQTMVVSVDLARPQQSLRPSAARTWRLLVHLQPDRSPLPSAGGDRIAQGADRPRLP
jgi:hypothetical protein